MKILRKTLHIGGMSCVNCEHRIRYVLKTAPGIQDATVSYNTGLAHVTYDTDTISLKQIREIIEKNGYTILPETGTSDYDMKKKLCLTGCYPVFICPFTAFRHSQPAGTRTAGRYKNGLWHAVCDRTYYICTLYCHVRRHQPVPVYSTTFKCL